MAARLKLTYDNALIHVADLCAKSEHCEAEIRTKLYKWGISSADSLKIITYLKENDFINEIRYAKTFSHDRLRLSNWGRNKIKKGLIQKRISAHAIEIGLESIDEQEYIEHLQHLIKVKTKEYDINNYEERLKIYRHLFCRGFESPLILQYINKYKAE